MKAMIRMGIAAAMLVSIQVKADVVGFQAGVSYWMPDYTGNFSLGTTGGGAGTQVDIKNDLGFDRQSLDMFWVAIEHPVPIFPNLRFSSSNLDATSSATLGKTISYGGETFNASTNVTSRFDLSNTEFTLYYELLDNWVNLDAGLTLRKYNGQAEMSATGVDAAEKIDFSIPLIYLNARFDLPFSGLFIDAGMSTLSVGDNSISETAFALGYESDFGLGGRLGYRTHKLKVDESNLVSDLKFSGFYLNAFYHF